MRAMLVAAAVLVVGEVCLLALGMQVVNSPLVYGPWPDRVSEAGLRSATRAGLQACVQLPDPAPSGCPQASALPAPVHWAMAGDPLRHAGFEMIGKSGSRRTFQVWGTYAMVAIAGTQADASEGPYLAGVVWDGRRLEVSGVRRGGFATERPAEATDEAASAAALRGMATCGTAPDAPLCPVVGGAPIHLSPIPDRLQGSSATYDRSTGVLHLRGSLLSDSVRRTYDAHETVGPNGRLVCYLITYS